MKSSEPIDCPRGWGDVVFSTEIENFPFVTISRKCPIAGVSNCASCGHPHNPARIEQLRATLADLELLCEEGKLTENEYQEQRRMLLSFQHSIESNPGDAALITAWVLGPLAIVVTGVGGFLGATVNNGKGLYSIAAIGVVMLAVSISFAGIGLMKRSRYQRRLETEPDDFYMPRS